MSVSNPQHSVNENQALAMEVRDVHGGYGNKTVLSGASLQLEPGTTTGLLGRNGSGKTTLIHTALGLKAPTKGEAFLHGEPAWDAPEHIRAKLGFVPQQFNAFDWMYVEQCLDFVGDCYPTWDKAYVAQMKEKWLPDPQQRIRELSPGQVQRLATLLAIGHKPDLLVLDEPVASMDPGARRDFFGELAGFAIESQQTVLLSSHITADIERFCSHVAIMHQGKILLHEPLDELRETVQVYSCNEVQNFSTEQILAQTEDSVWVRTTASNTPEKLRGAPMLLEDFFLAVTS